MDSRRNRGIGDAGLPKGGSGKRATVPAQSAGEKAPGRDPIAPRLTAVTPTADPTALPGNGARVVPRPAGGARRADDRTQEPSREADGPDDREQGEALRGR
jgi:two-component system sensor histidine kinase MtrB